MLASFMFIGKLYLLSFRFFMRDGRISSLNVTNIVWCRQWPGVAPPSLPSRGGGSTRSTSGFILILCFILGVVLLLLNLLLVGCCLRRRKARLAAAKRVTGECRFIKQAFLYQYFRTARTSIWCCWYTSHHNYGCCINSSHAPYHQYHCNCFLLLQKEAT